MGEGSEGSLCIARAINKSGVGELLVNTGGRGGVTSEGIVFCLLPHVTYDACLQLTGVNKHF